MNWTNEEQSRRLVELGLDTNTADMCLVKNPADEFRPVCGTVKYVTDLREQTGYKAEIIPCWSVGALLEVMPECIGSYELHLRTYYKGVWCCEYVEDGINPIKTSNSSMIVAIYEMVVWLLENNYIKNQ